jgi:hypothetical protein
MRLSAIRMMNTPFPKGIFPLRVNAGYGIRIARLGSNRLLAIAGNCGVMFLLGPI